jgi:hypothetical protein
MGLLPSPLVRFCQLSRQRSDLRLGARPVRILHDIERNADRLGEAGAAKGSGDGLVVTATRAKKIAEFTVFFIEALDGIVALEVSHTSDLLRLLRGPGAQPAAGERRGGDGIHQRGGEGRGQTRGPNTARLTPYGYPSSVGAFLPQKRSLRPSPERHQSSSAIGSQA